MTVNKQKFLLTVLATTLFWSISLLGYKIGEDFGFEQMLFNFGEPRDLYPVLFALVSVFTGLLFSVMGVVITLLAMHQVGRRFKVAVGKPTFYGFLLYLLTLLIIILNFNRTH
ncbi:MAG: hypothetical protein AAB486_04705 [Patescibacteria group bacterium]